MLRADPLSRRPDHEEGVHEDNNGRLLLKPEYFAIKAMQTTHHSDFNDATLVERIKVALTDDEMTSSYQSLLKTGRREFGKTMQEWNFEDGLLLHRGKIYVPQDHTLRMDLIHAHHDSTLAGHPGRWKTLELVSRNYWWSGMSMEIGRAHV